MVPYGFNLPPLSRKPPTKFETVLATISGGTLIATFIAVIAALVRG